MAEAVSAAARLGSTTSSRQPAFGQAGLTLYQVSIAQVLGDSGTAIEHARTIRTADIPTPERQGRYWVDVARAWHQWGKPEACYRALLAAERAAPAEVRYRPPVHRMTEDLLRAGARGSLPGLPRLCPPGRRTRPLEGQAMIPGDGVTLRAARLADREAGMNSRTRCP